jgi:hypothetical protein
MASLSFKPHKGTLVQWDRTRKMKFWTDPGLRRLAQSPWFPRVFAGQYLIWFMQAEFPRWSKFAKGLSPAKKEADHRTVTTTIGPGLMPSFELRVSQGSIKSSPLAIAPDLTVDGVLAASIRVEV